MDSEVTRVLEKTLRINIWAFVPLGVKAPPGPENPQPSSVEPTFPGIVKLMASACQMSFISSFLESRSNLYDWRRDDVSIGAVNTCSSPFCFPHWKAKWKIELWPLQSRQILLLCIVWRSFSCRTELDFSKGTKSVFVKKQHIDLVILP